MPKILVAYYSKTGNTKKMANAIAEAIKGDGVEVDLKDVQKVEIPSLKGYDGIILGSPTYYGLMAGPVKDFIDRSVTLHGKLAGKVGGAFATSANLGGGNETTVLSIIQALLIHGMVVIGDQKGAHYGPVSVGKPDECALEGCKRYATKVAQLIRNITK